MLWPSPGAVEAAAEGLYNACEFRAGEAAIRTALVAAEPFLREVIAAEVEAMVRFSSNSHEIGYASRIAARIRAGGPAEAEGDTDA